MDVSVRILQPHDLVVDAVFAVLCDVYNFAGEVRRQQTQMQDRGGLRTGSIRLTALHDRADLDLDRYIVFALGIEDRHIEAVRDERAGFFLQRAKRALNAVKNIGQDARAQRDRHRCAGGFDRFSGLQAGCSLIDLNGGLLVRQTDDLADQPALTDIDHLHHGEDIGIAHLDDRAVDAVNDRLHQASPPPIL